MPGGEIDRLHVDVGDAVEDILAERLHRLRGMADAGIVDQDVEAAEIQQRRLHHGGDIAVHRDIDGDAMGHLAEGGRHALAGGWVAIGDQHPGALGHEFACDARPESRAAAGYDRCLACKPHGPSPLCQPWSIATVFRVEKP